MEAWTEAYNSLADIFINREKEIYYEQEKEIEEFAYKKLIPLNI